MIVTDRLTSRRRANGRHELFFDAKSVGRAWRCGNTFSLHLDGWYWRGGEPNQKSGASGIGGFLRLRDALAKADQVLRDATPTTTEPHNDR